MKTEAIRDLMIDYLTVCGRYNGNFGKAVPDANEEKLYAEALEELQAIEASQGEWTKIAPTTPGRYRVADIHGVELLTPIELKIVDGELVHYHNGGYVPAAQAHRGWWWSVPNPTLPRP